MEQNTIPDGYWEDARGCKIEHDAAKAYGLEVLYED